MVAQIARSANGEPTLDEMPPAGGFERVDVRTGHDGLERKVGHRLEHDVRRPCTDGTAVELLEGAYGEAVVEGELREAIARALVGVSSGVSLLAIDRALVSWLAIFDNGGFDGLVRRRDVFVGYGFDAGNPEVVGQRD